MSNTLLKYINNKGLGSGIDDVQEIQNVPPLATSVPTMSLMNYNNSIIQNSTGVWQNMDNMKIPSSGTVALVGCSVTQMNQIGAGLYGSSRQCDYGWANWLAHYLGGFDILYNFAIGGASSGPLAFDPLNNVITQLPQALAVNTDWIWMDFGILNDIQRSCTVDQSLAYVDQILRMVSGRNVVAINCTPLESPHTWFTPERMAYMQAVNAGIAERARPYKNVILIDANKATVNPVGVGEAKAGYLQADDHIHYTHRMCRAIAAEGKNTIGSKIVIVDTKSPRSNADVYNATSNPKRAQTNPKLIGSGGTNNISATLTGTVPAGCALSKAGTSITGTSAVDTTNGGWTVSVTAVGAANDKLFVTVTSAADGWATSGDVVRGGFKLSFSGMTNVLYWTCQISATVDSVTKTISTCLEPDNTDGSHGQTTVDGSDGVIYVRIPAGAIPSGTTVTTLKVLLIATYSSTTATSVFKIEDAWLEKV